MAYFAGIDISQRQVSICVLDQEGKRLWRGKCLTDPVVITATLEEKVPDGRMTLGLETGPLSPWLVHSLRQAGLSVVCLDARAVHAALSTRVNKNDQNDAEGLAQILRLGWYRPVHVKSYEAHRVRAMLGARAQLVGMVVRLSNQVRGLLKVFGIVVAGVRGASFGRRVEELVTGRPEVAEIVRPLLEAWRMLRQKVAGLDTALRAQARTRDDCRLLMTVPGVGAITALAFASAVDDPARFRRSRDVGAHLGLTPRQYQSGEMDCSGAVSRCGDRYVRTLLFEAATTLLSRVQRWSAPKAWAVRLAKRAGMNKARTALARKLAVLLHTIWRRGEPFRWGAAVAA
jgi:transposase